MSARYVVGIDLGTTNCALAYADLKATGPELEIKVLEVPQLVGPGRLGQREVLPSFLYLPGEFEFVGDLALPWDPERRYAVGVFARDQGALVPSRLVSSAKSWLCHGGVDREAPILPWGAGEEVPKISPVEASARYLQHLREAWNYLMARDDPEAALEKQLVIVTVPASFDEVARELTLKAAQMAGLEEVVLLEEPVAALYAWLSRHEKDWQEHLHEGERVLVCDVGGGTSDFTVVEVKRGPEGLSLERVAVGDHILLGGDNIDLSLARLAERKLPKARLDFARFQTLTFLCRQLKERLLAPDGPEEDAVRLPGRGRALIAETLVAKVSKEEVLELILKEFLPQVEFSSSLARVESVPRVMREWGLPFARDPAITRHLAAFLYKHEVQAVDVILFNGGALKPPVLRERLREEVSRWFGQSVRELETVSLDLAVAVG
ncbi:MAG: Hsp70 family protein, partial [Thermodesulfobacteria bacterium]|nr:Hsp70 family protein [Thermodesulfobacteriota bacterium]